MFYTTNPDTFEIDQDDYEDVTGLPLSCKDVIIYGAAYRMASFMDVGRLPAESAEVDQIDGQTPIGSGGTVTRALYALYQQRLSVASKRQQEDFPIRVRYGR